MRGGHHPRLDDLLVAGSPPLSLAVSMTSRARPHKSHVSGVKPFQARVNAAIHASFRILSLRQLFNQYPDRLLAFLQAPGIARPQTGPQLWVEEETEQGIG